jgi:hypothetical protein
MSTLPGTRKMPLQPVFPETLDPKVERVLRWMWEEQAKYLNTLAVAIPFTDNNYNGNYEISTGGGNIVLPLGNYSNFNDQNYWRPLYGVDYNMNIANNNLTIELKKNGNNYSSGNTSRISQTAGVVFRPKLLLDANGRLSFRYRIQTPVYYAKATMDGMVLSAIGPMQYPSAVQHYSYLNGATRMGPTGENNAVINNYMYACTYLQDLSTGTSGLTSNYTDNNEAATWAAGGVPVNDCEFKTVVSTNTRYESATTNYKIQGYRKRNGVAWPANANDTRSNNNLQESFKRGFYEVSLIGFAGYGAKWFRGSIIEFEVLEGIIYNG